ncbi:MAG: DUF2085 domain-containing protein [Thermomicrobiales bacterium]
MVEQAIEGCPTCGEAVAGTGGPRTRSRKMRLVLALDRVIYRVAKRWLFYVNSVFFAYVVGIFLAPALTAAGIPQAAKPIYGFYGLFCHQRADRSFFVLGRKMACCQRCFAIYGSIFLMGLLFAVVRRPARPMWSCSRCRSRSTPSRRWPVSGRAPRRPGR